MIYHNNLHIYQKDAQPYNISYGEWTARWWQWALSIPIDKNPLLDHAGEHCDEGQSGPVWFLAGTTGKTYSARRKCTISSGKSILFPIIASQFSFAEVPFLKTEEELISYTAKDIDHSSLLEAVIDGIDLKKLHEYRCQFGPFDLTFPDNNIWNVRPGQTRAVSDGFWVFLEPLSDGNHTINFRGVEPNFHTDVTYQILIKP